MSEASGGAVYGDSFMDELAGYIQQEFPGIRGFNRRNLYRMKQFYETYAGNEKVSPLVTQISWTNNVLLLYPQKKVWRKRNFI